MDALKRAEQEKREAARKLEDSSPASRFESESADDATGQNPIQHETAASSRPRELSLEPVSGEFASPTAGAGSAPESAPTVAGSENPTLSVTGEQPLAMQLNTSLPIAAPAKPSPSGLADQIIPEEGDDGERTFHGFGVNASAPSVPGMYEETMRGDMETPAEGPGYDETLPGVSALQLAKDIGIRDQPTPVAAETVFAAGRSREETGPGLKWVLGGLTAVMLTAAGIWYYLTVTPVARNVPSPWVARGIESVPGIQGEAGLPVRGGAGLPVAVPVEAVPVAPVDVAAAGGLVSEPPTAAMEASVPTPGVPEVAAIREPAAPISAAETAAPASPPADHAIESPAVMPAAPSLIRISREAEISDQDRMVREGYTLYQAGDLAGAESMYLAVLNAAPDNIDALLGYGAIALRRGEISKAVEAHGAVLRLDPDNDTALAVLVGLNKSVDLNGAESAINSLTKENPEQPFLYFTLGNIYAAQLRWPEAQQAFFDAHRIDSSNPDYALNLAVSLDRMGQQQPALDYYNTALRLAEHHPASFDPAAIMARIQSLSATAIP